MTRSQAAIAHRSVFDAVAVGLVVLVMQGCGGADLGDHEATPISLVESISVEPFAEFEVGAPRQERASRAIEELTVECMSRRGFVMERTDWAAETAGMSSQAARGDRYGLWISDQAMPKGDGPDQEDAGPTEEDIAPEVPKPEGYYIAYWGDENDEASWVKFDSRHPERGSIQRGGCLGEAERTIYGPLEEYYPLSERLSNAVWEALDLAESDPRGRELLDAFAGCMASHGYQASMPGQALAIAAEHDPAHLDDVTTAEVSCAARNGTIQKFEQLIWNYQRQWIDDHPTEVQEFIAMWDQIDRRAAIELV